jgi:hypothetical protein
VHHLSDSVIAGKMRATPCLSKGFFGRSVEEFKRLSNVGMFVF